MRISVIGCGNMGGAIASALADAGWEVSVYDSVKEKAEEMASGRSTMSVLSSLGGASGSGAIILAVKPQVLPSLYESLKEGHVFYTSNYGIPALRKEIAKWETEHHGVQYDADEVLVTVGVGEATYASMAAFLEDGDEVLVPNPVWLNEILDTVIGILL